MNTESWSHRSWSCKKLISSTFNINTLCDLSNPSKKGWVIASLAEPDSHTKRAWESGSTRLGDCMTTVIPQETGRNKQLSLTFWVVLHCWLHTQHDLCVVCTMGWKLDLVPRLTAWNQAMPIVSNPTHFWNEAEVQRISNSTYLKRWRLCGSSVSSFTNISVTWVTWNEYV